MISSTERKLILAALLFGTYYIVQFINIFKKARVCLHTGLGRWAVFCPCSRGSHIYSRTEKLMSLSISRTSGFYSWTHISYLKTHTGSNRNWSLFSLFSGGIVSAR